MRLLSYLQELTYGIVDSWSVPSLPNPSNSKTPRGEGGLDGTSSALIVRKAVSAARTYYHQSSGHSGPCYSSGTDEVMIPKISS